MIELLTRIAVMPTVAALLPKLVEALAKFFVERAGRLELKAATKQARAAKTAEEYRRASEKLSDAVRGG